jgi:hypothetical protein
VHWVVTQPYQASRLLPAAGFDWLQAPVMPEQRRDGPPLNYADILLRFGYANGTDLLGLVVAWRELLRLTGARVVLADHAPTAILAARTLGLPVMLFGSGFFAPPQVIRRPTCGPGRMSPRSYLLVRGRDRLADINAVLRASKGPPLIATSPSFSWSPKTACRLSRAGPLSSAGRPATGACCPPRQRRTGELARRRPGPKVFSYLRPETPMSIRHCTRSTDCLSILIYAPGLPEDMIRRYALAAPRLFSRPVDLNKVAAKPIAGLTYASPATTTAFLMAGKPVLMMPGHLEQFLFARRVEEMGAGLDPEPGTGAGRSSPAMLQRSARPGPGAPTHGPSRRKYANFDQNAAVIAHCRRIEELACTGQRNGS